MAPSVGPSEAVTGASASVRIPDCKDTHIVAHVIRLDKGHTEGLEPNVTEEVVKPMDTAM